MRGTALKESGVQEHIEHACRRAAYHVRERVPVELGEKGALGAVKCQFQQTRSAEWTRTFAAIDKVAQGFTRRHDSANSNAGGGYQMLFVSPLYSGIGFRWAARESQL
jgi:hypothetical protein